jgi:hypothetical protein
MPFPLNKAAGTTTLTNVSSSASSVQLLASREARRAFYIHNDSPNDLFVKFGTTASTSSFTVKLLGGAFFEAPTDPIYTGRVDGIWSAASGAARITEIY